MGACLSKKGSSQRQQQPRHQNEYQKNGKEIANSNGTQNNTETKSEKPKSKQAVAVQDQKKTRITVSDGRDNNVIPLGKRTNFGYNRDFAKKYTLGKLLGHGQFGYTYIGIEKATSNKAAIKCIEKKQMKLSISVEDVKREVRILQTLSGHKNIVQFYAAFEDDDKVYIVMELCEGGELLDRILAKKNRLYSEKDAAIVVRQMLNVAARCHLNGVVHRDLKPENFLFKSPAEDSPLKAVDFGLSDYIKPGKYFTDVVGSAYYVAPEVLKRKSGPESDMWSIGVITYILLCGRRPFWDKTEQGIFNEVLKKSPDFKDKPWPTISNSAVDFVKKLLQKDPHLRLSAAQALCMSSSYVIQLLHINWSLLVKCMPQKSIAKQSVIQFLLDVAAHEWVREEGVASDMPLDISVLSNMREFVKYSRLKQIALRALASTLDKKEIADLQDQFEAIDVDRNGVITLEEMKKALAEDKPWKVKESRVLEILEAMDSDMDGMIDFDEFVAATMHVHQLEESDSEKWESRSRAAFSKLDRDGDGYITPDELQTAMGMKGSVSTLLDEADTDGDGRLSLPEFQKLLHRASFGSGTRRDHYHHHR